MTGLFDSFDKEDDKKEESSRPKSEIKTQYKKRQEAKVILILKHKNEMVVEVDGNGVKIKYDESKHSNVKVGDTISL